MAGVCVRSRSAADPFETCSFAFSARGEKPRARGQLIDEGKKKQGRRRSMPPTTLPAPEIKIGLRLPVNCTLPRILAGKCEPVHIQQKIPFGKKVAWCRSGGDKPVAGLFALTFRWRPIGPATQQKLRKLYGLLRRLAADRGARTSDPAGKAVSVQPRTSVFDLQRAPARAMPRIHLRMADCIKSAAGMDASRLVGPDPAGGQFSLARR